MRGDDNYGEGKTNPRATANWLSAVTFWKRDLEEDDLPDCLEEHKSSVLGRKIALNWSKECDRALRNKRKPSMTKVIVKTFYADILKYGLVVFIMEMFVRLAQPIFIGLFIRYFSDENRQNTKPIQAPMYFNRVIHYASTDQGPIQTFEAYFFAGGIMLCSCIIVLTTHPFLMACMHIGMKVRVAVCSLIYRKALRIKFSCLDGTVVGNAVNLMSNDINRFDLALMFTHYLWVSPLQMLAIFYFLYGEVNISGGFGLVAILIFIPLQIFYGIRISVLRRRSAELTDNRVREMNETVRSMQVIKMYAWEEAFADLIHTLRRKELNVLIRISYIRGIIMSFIMFTARTGIFLTVMAYVLLGNKITAENTFVIASYYQILRQTMTVYFPQAVNMMAEALVSIRRIGEFMLIEEATIGDHSPLDPLWPAKPKTSIAKHRIQQLQLDEKPRVRLVHGIAKYGSDVCLDDVNLECWPGEITAVVGPVGAGKSCLLQLILGELTLFSGLLTVKGTISYACQDPWLFAGSVRQNILFGHEMEITRYREVVKVCALLRDFSLLPYGDRTIIGERGASLSGGQRARINLARAVYKKADIYLLDDPLSAVDINVGQQLFEQCIMNYLKDKIVILITHQLQYLKKVNQIIIMHEGLFQGKGTYEELKKSGLSFAALLEEQATTVAPKPEKEVEKVLRRVSIISAAFNSMVDIEGQRFSPQAAPEMRTYGSVEFDNYKQYFSAGGNCCAIFIMVLLFLLAQALASGGDFFLAQWVNLERLRSHTGTAASMGFYDELSTDNCIWIYTVIIVATAVAAVTRSLTFFTICMRASMRLHDRMFTSIIHASMRFFNTNTSGRILNRFSKDLGAVDELLPYALMDTTQIMLNLIGAVVVVAILEPFLLIPNTVLCLIFYFLRRLYLKTSRSVKRLEGICRSPVFAHLNATMAGLPTIRSNDAEQILVTEFDKLQDVHSSAWFMFLYTSRAYSFLVDLICTIYIGIVTFSFVLLADEYDGSSVGLAITQVLGLSFFVQWGMRQSAELENQMTAVERVLEFTKVEHEPDLHSTPDRKPPVTWPKQGKIEFIETTMRYNTFESPVLKNLNFLIKAKEKIGIVGRTGAGKSSLMSALFRLSNYEGQILIDNLDISVLGLHDLRKKISIIPQEPILFTGTLRYNLDPFNEYKDEDVLSALTEVEIKNVIVHGSDCLNDLMAEGGTNLSVGQRQMVCLARAILRNNTILVMDEATANVDAGTDKFIQHTVRTKFAHCTVLTIAHRLHTIMDSDRVLVMDAGEAVEFDHPHLLLQKKNGYFSEMVKKTGPGMSDTLIRIARESYQTRQNSPSSMVAE
ncbi:hypothetical protein NQ315_015681 [Exocentrus adspersus]|uniref:Multidrug resistance-associated protein lethal(2)03659 n=1 Tax=Exocentrus adspersus TaxID=1586481 RepID=A0AAV8W2K0_9CUCU|nr:hypothetical protein NQ315_015681 [Exocentrus adspersus]